MLTFDLRPMLKSRGMRHPYAFLKKLGMSHPVAQRLASGDTKMIKIDHIEAVCLALHCTPNDLMHWSPSGEEIAEDHPLHKLKRQDGNIDFFEELRDLPLDKLNALKATLKEMKEED